MAGADTTLEPVPCGAIEEAELIKRIFPQRDMPRIAVNLLGHGSIVMTDTIDALRCHPWKPRPVPELVSLPHEPLTIGKLTYANVDLPCDNWAWAIVTDYEGSQEYGEVIVAFLPEYEPDHETVRNMMAAMEARGRVMKEGGGPHDAATATGMYDLDDG